MNNFHRTFIHPLDVSKVGLLNPKSNWSNLWTFLWGNPYDTQNHALLNILYVVQETKLSINYRIIKVPVSIKSI